MKGSKGNLILLVMTGWIYVLGAFFSWLEIGTLREKKQLAQTTAKAFFQQVLISRLWNASFCCGNQLIDSQHQSLFHICNELLEAILSARPPAEIAAIIP